MQTGEIVGKELLGKPGEGVNGTFIVQDGLDILAIAEPIEVGSPEVATTLAHGPTARASFAREGVLERFSRCAWTRAELDRAEASAAEELIE